MRILIAEDERITRRTLQRQLESWGHEVQAAEDGAAAWEQYQQDQFDLVVTDWDMPGIDGHELIQRIRGHTSSRYTYLIMLTGRSEKDDLVTGMEAGADDFLAKPFDRNELRVRLSAGERIIRLERELARQNDTLTTANHRMKRDLDAAASVQRELLPTELPDSLGVKFAWHYRPCDELGGDILNVIPLSDGRIAMYLLDVSGHGVPAALLSVTLSRVLSTHDLSLSPPETARRLNQQFPMGMQSGRYFTIVCGVLDPRTRELQYTLGGHPPPILARSGQAPEQLSGSGYPIGMVPDADFDDYRLELASGDRLIFYSDGMTEARNMDDNMLKPEGFVRMIDEARGLPLDECLTSCVGALERWCDPRPFDDDVSMLALEIP